MKRVALFTVLSLTALCLVGATTGGEAEKTLIGEYQWTQGNTSDELKAVFTADGKSAWEVKFYFDFRDKPHVYTGRAQGSLTDGPLKGEVKNESKRRTFTFEGTVKNGVFHGKHAELQDGEPYATGTLDLS